MNSTRKIHLLSLMLFLAPLISFGQDRPLHNDGPYVFHQGDSLHIQWVEQGIGYDTLIAKKDAGIFKRTGLPRVDLQHIDFDASQQASFDGVEKMIAISDLHGQFDVFMDLLRAHHVIGPQRKWSYGKGHLIIVGDNLDRGDQVLDILWFLFYLQKQAATAGGKVHVLLGNHEFMVLNGDIRYISKKYRYTSGLFTTPYFHFFRPGSVLGDWIASHQIMTSINKKLFVHGGISPVVMSLNLSVDELNQLFKTQLIRADEDKILQNRTLTILNEQEGPLWYRGYFNDPINEADIDKILKTLDQETIVVGHTSADSIRSLFNGKVIAVDCNIKLGQAGQILIWKNQTFFTGFPDGSKKAIQQEIAVSIETKTKKEEKKNSLFNYIYQIKDRPKITITSNTRTLIGQSSKEEYQPAHFLLQDANGKELLNTMGRARARGNIRKKVCKIPPIKFDFKDELLDSLGFADIDKLKFVFPCNSAASSQEKLYKEFFLYELYNEIDTNCIRTKLVDISIISDGKEKYTMVGFIIEDEEEYAHRTNAIVIEKGRAAISALDRAAFLQVLFFQYMISNTDWSIQNKHNLELVKLPQKDKIVLLPYDFDYAGFVGQEYAIPNASLNIDSVHDRYVFSHCRISQKEFYFMVKKMLALEKQINACCDKATYMKSYSIEENKKYLASFFKSLRYPKQLEGQFIK